jgi:hypothetical protein
MVHVIAHEPGQGYHAPAVLMGTSVAEENHDQNDQAVRAEQSEPTDERIAPDVDNP